jgi:septal ring factor EnvC (AmiA/AmiB activator)
MQDRLGRFERLTQATLGQERVLQEDVARLALACRRLEAEVDALAVAPTAREKQTAAEMAHRRRYLQQAARQREELQAGRESCERQWRVAKRRLTEVAQTRRTLQHLVGRLERLGEQARRHGEQQAVDEYGRGRDRGRPPWHSKLT